ncbi:nicotinate phosphoribosyltransferase [Cetobacterium ceti]|uniref:Nicotinate phosphoribosyltransferase n=1 Tax=Cetobacterium ceti TaxID=180163 RepID=A0A1T4K1C2_9FUSO|nr:nicotinate phosphoribosyltransferase [Cetobacterium ceti]SJZ36169.1 nicotinate phosphoribosyltransferase [Cetobacterium ceti]
MIKENILTEFAKVINSDRYQYTESDVFLMEGMENKEAVFDMYFRKTEDGGFAVVSGIQEVINLIKILNNTSEEEKKYYFSQIIEEEHLVSFLSKMTFTGDLYAMRDGEIVYPNEPVITIKAPLIQAKILETPILNIMNMQLAIATKASRITRAAHPIPVSSFGSRRAHGFDSAVAGTKASIIGGCVSHSNLVTEYKYNVPSVGTMSHSFIQTFGVGKEAEIKAFNAFIKHRQNRKQNSLILLIDTYNTIEIGILNAIKAFKENNIDDSYNGIYGVRIDSGDLAYLSKKCRTILDNAGLKKAKIFLTNSLNESLIKSLKEQEAAVDLFGVGDAIAVSKSNPCFGGVYKIVEIDKEPVIKLSEDVIKISNPGFKEVYRIFDHNHEAYADLITLVNNDEDKDTLLDREDLVIRDEKYEFKNSTLKKETYTFKKLTKTFVKNGIVNEKEYSILLDIFSSREYYLESLNDFSRERKRLENPHKYKVDLSKDLLKLKYSLIKKIKQEIKN